MGGAFRWDAAGHSVQGCQRNVRSIVLGAESIRSYIKIIQAELAEASLGSRCGSVFFLFCGKIRIDRGRGLLYNIMMQLIWSFRPCGLGFDKIEVTF